VPVSLGEARARLITFSSFVQFFNLALSSERRTERVSNVIGLLAERRLSFL
jgi:hypothetical protein